MGIGWSFEKLDYACRFLNNGVEWVSVVKDDVQLLNGLSYTLNTIDVVVVVTIAIQVTQHATTSIGARISEWLEYLSQFLLEAQCKPQQTKLEADVLAWVMEKSMSEEAVQEALRAIAGGETPISVGQFSAFPEDIGVGGTYWY
ncbi:hypothetical protein BU17DRAFT_68555 [Hysterangium stoloniferum]|nr:hypothetical protein BU17DRAFT_68555 [Hysterangium stoloniferum]